MLWHLNLKIMGFKQTYHVQLYHIHQPNQMHVHTLMYDLPHCITILIHQCMIIFKCMFMIFKQSKTLINCQKDKTKQNKIKQSGRDLKLHKLG